MLKCLFFKSLTVVTQPGFVLPSSIAVTVALISILLNKQTVDRYSRFDDFTFASSDYLKIISYNLVIQSCLVL